MNNIIKHGPRATLVNCQFDEEFTSVKWIEYNGRLYKAGKCVERIGIKDDLPHFGLVTAVVMRQMTVFFFYQNINTLGFDEHRHSYLVEPPEINAQNQYVNIKDLLDVTPLYLRKTNNYYITVTYAV